MTPTAPLFLSLAAIAGLWYLVFWLYRDLRVDIFRQELFALRDEVFDYAAAGHISFEAPAYGLLRSAMNGFIRFGHRFNALQVLIFALLNGRDGLPHAERFDRVWSTALNSLDQETKGALIDFRSRMHQLVFKHVILSSPLLVASLVIPLGAWIAGLFCRSLIARVLRGRLDEIDSAALAFGQ